MELTLNYTPNAKQALFHGCGSHEVLYGGAKRGGKSHALVMEALVYGLEHKGALIYLFRETFDELEANLIMKFKMYAPKQIYSYAETKHIATLYNGSMIYFRFISSDADADTYQGRDMDWVGVDELTRHTERTIKILLSCLNSPKGFPTYFRATSNPGGIGHTWVKKRYITSTQYGKKQTTIALKRRDGSIYYHTISFIPANVYDNDVVMENDPEYASRLEDLPEIEKQMFLHGNWDIFAGQYFSEFEYEVHTCEPFEIPSWWQRFISLDYGLDCTAPLWWAVDGQGRCYIYKEMAVSDLIYSQAVESILELNTVEKIENNEVVKYQEKYEYIVASPDLWARTHDTGETGFEIMSRLGLRGIIPAINSRIMGWRTLKQYLTPFTDENENKRAKLTIFRNCPKLIENLTQLQHDDKNYDDVSSKNHDISHLPESLRYGIMSRPQSGVAPEEPQKPDFWNRDTTILRNEEITEPIPQSYIEFGA